jgi:hypothetical protein
MPSGRRTAAEQYDSWNQEQLRRHENERKRQQEMAGFAFNDYTPSYAYSDDNFTTSATSVYYGVPYGLPPPRVVKNAEPDEGPRGWLDIELDKILTLGRAEPVFA